MRIYAIYKTGYEMAFFTAPNDDAALHHSASTSHPGWAIQDVTDAMKSLVDISGVGVMLTEDGHHLPGEASFSLGAITITGSEEFIREMAELDTKDRDEEKNERPNIGDPDFEWKVGMVAVNRLGDERLVSRTDGPPDSSMVIFAGNSKNSWVYNSDGTARGKDGYDLRGQDLVEIIRWPE